MAPIPLDTTDPAVMALLEELVVAVEGINVSLERIVFILRCFNLIVWGSLLVRFILFVRGSSTVHPEHEEVFDGLLVRCRTFHFSLSLSIFHLLTVGRIRTPQASSTEANDEKVCTQLSSTGSSVGTLSATISLVYSLDRFERNDGDLDDTAVNQERSCVGVGEEDEKSNKWY